MRPTACIDDRAIMRYRVLACDYDGTIATHGLVDTATQDALRRLKASGRKVILVTGRELDDLSRVFPELTLFDWIVAENGALLYDPRGRETRNLALPPDETFVRTLATRGVEPLSVGQSIVATWEPHETVVLETIRELGLELQVIFNKGAVMVLPSGVNKATGLAVALDELGLSAHNAVGVGDAENDHAFLSTCACAVAVANALDSLKQRVDLVTVGDHGAGVVELVDRMLLNDLADVDSSLARHRLVLGETADGSAMPIPPFGASVLIAGPSGVGKSTVARGLIERVAARGYQFCLFDPEGDYQDEEHAVCLRGADEDALMDEAMQLLSSPGNSVVVGLLDIRLEDRPPFFQKALPILEQLFARTSRPHWLIVDEAHHMLPSDWQPVEQPLLSSAGNVLMITVHPEHISPAVREQVGTLVAVGRDVESEAQAFADGRADLITAAPPTPDRPGRWACVFQQGESPRWMQVSETHEERQRHRRKYAEGELGDKSFYFRGPAGKLKLKTQNLVMFSQIAEGVDDETWLYHLRRGDYSEWFRRAIKDVTLAEVAEGIERDRGLSATESRRRIREAIEERYTSPA